MQKNVTFYVFCRVSYSYCIGCAGSGYKVRTVVRIRIFGPQIIPLPVRSPHFIPGPVDAVFSRTDYRARCYCVGKYRRTKG